MPDLDPLAERHGTLIAEGWRVIAAARDKISADAAPHACLNSIRQMRRRVLAAHHGELLRNDMTGTEINDWFDEIELTLAKAEAYFNSLIRTDRTERMRAVTRRHPVIPASHPKPASVVGIN